MIEAYTRTAHRSAEQLEEIPPERSQRIQPRLSAQDAHAFCQQPKSVQKIIKPKVNSSLNWRK